MVTPKQVGCILVAVLAGMFALDLIFEMLNASCTIVNILALVIMIIVIMVAVHTITKHIKNKKHNENI